MTEKMNTHTMDIQTLTKKEFENLFCTFYAQVVAFATGMLEDKDAGEDVAQEVFVYVWEKRNKLHLQEGIKSYLFRSAYTKSIDYLKKGTRADKISQKMLSAVTEEYRCYLDNDCEPLKKLFSKDFDENLQKLLEQLPEVKRRIFMLTYYEGLKAREVSELMDIPQRTVESHIYHTMRFLRTKISSSDFFLLFLLLRFF